MKSIDYQKSNGFSVFLSFMKPHRKLFILDMVCAFMVSVVDLAYPLISRHCLNTMLPGRAFAAFFTVMGCIVAAYLLRSALYFVITYWGHIFGIRVEADIRETLFSHFQELGFEFYDQNRTGNLMSRLTTDLFEITELSHHGPEDAFISLVTVFGALVVMFTIEWRLAVVVAILVPAFVVLVFLRRGKMGQASKQVKQTTGVINADIESNLSGIRTAKAFTNEDAEREKFHASNEQYKKSKRLFYREMGVYFSVMELFVSILSVTVICMGGYFIMTGSMDLADLIAFSLYVTTFVNPIRKLSALSEIFANGVAGFGRFMQLMRTEPTIRDLPDAKTLQNVKGSIDVQNVRFSYSGRREILHDVSLHVKPCETVAIVGPSGGGKSTLCHLLPRFYDVCDGKILLDGTDIRELTQKSLRQNIGMVQQDVFLFADTVYENIRYGRLDATKEEIIEAAKRAEIYDDVMAMPDGFDTYVGERGTRLSGGQKQRISIARIFLKDPPILILDEATSSLDSLTESKIQHAFDELAKNRTTLIIAHRLSTIRKAGRILVVRDGKIAEEGTHESLLAANGVYAELYRTQNPAK